MTQKIYQVNSLSLWVIRLYDLTVTWIFVYFKSDSGGGNDAVSLLLHCDEYLATHKTLPGLSDRYLITPAFPGFVDYWLGGEQLVWEASENQQAYKDRNCVSDQ